MSVAMATLRAEVMDRPQGERVDYALHLMAFYLDPLPAFYSGCANLGLVMKMADMRMLHALDKRRGHYVTINSLIAARGLDRHCDLWPGPDYAIKRISAIRGQLAGAGLPVEIKTWRHVGYSLQAPRSFRFEVGA